MEPTVPEAICARTAAAGTDINQPIESTNKPINQSTNKSAISNQQFSEGLEDRADDRPRELGGHPFEAVGVLLEEGGGIGRRAPAGRFVLLTQHHARILPQHLVLA